MASTQDPTPRRNDPRNGPAHPGHARDLLLAIAATLVLGNGVSRAQSLHDIVPMAAPNCALLAPPAKAGVAVSPGGFIVMHPRGVDTPGNYTGCRLLWVADSDTAFRRFATLYFERGRLAVAVAHDPQEKGEPVRAACAYPGGKSLLRPSADGTRTHCGEVTAEPLYGLKPESYPLLCMRQPDAADCSTPR